MQLATKNCDSTKDPGIADIYYSLRVIREYLSLNSVDINLLAVELNYLYALAFVKKKKIEISL